MDNLLFEARCKIRSKEMTKVYEIAKVCKHGYMSDTDIFFARQEQGCTWSPASLARERRIACNKGLLKEKDFANRHNNGTHKRFIAAKGVK